MRFLITGGAGYIGSRIATMLLSRRHVVHVVDRLDYGADALLTHFEDPNFRLFPWEIEKHAYKMHYDWVLHLAAMVGEPLCSRRPDDCWRTNLGATEWLIKNYDYDHLLYFSTCSNYGVVKGEMANEETSTTPTGEYSMSKIAAEKLALADGGMVLRLGTICGLSQRMRFDTMLNEFALHAVQNKPLLIYNKEAWRPFLVMEDLLHCLPAALYDWRKNTHHGQIYNLITSNATKQNLADLVRSRFDELEIKYQDSGMDPRDYQVSHKKWATHFTPMPRSNLGRTFDLLCQAARTMADPNANHFVNNR